MEVSVSSLLGDLLCTSKTRWGCNVSTVERIVSHLNFNGLSVVSSHRLARLPILEPCNIALRLDQLWPAWLPRSLASSLPHSQVIQVFIFVVVLHNFLWNSENYILIFFFCLQLTIKSEYVALAISPDHVHSIKNLYKAFSQLFESQDGENQDGPSVVPPVSASTPASEAYSGDTGMHDLKSAYYVS